MEVSEGRGEVIFLEGIPSSGKTSTARELGRQVTELRIIHGDDEIRRLGRKKTRVLTPRQMFDKLLDLVERASQKQDVVVEGTFPGSYVEEARRRFPDGFFVSLQITEVERLAREKARKRKRPLVWNEHIAAQQGSEDLFDLVIDASVNAPAKCAELILEQFESEVDDELTEP
jgi:shikimate kinase